MRPDDIIKLLRAQPFRPFRISLSDGSPYAVTHPDLALVERSIVTIGVPGPKGRDAPLERTVQIALLHINKTEPLDLTNGSHARKRKH